MGLLGTYVGIIPVILGMLFFPALRRVGDDWIRLFMAVTIGLLGFLVIDGSLEGIEIGNQSTGAFGGAFTGTTPGTSSFTSTRSPTRSVFSIDADGM